MKGTLKVSWENGKIAVQFVDYGGKKFRLNIENGPLFCTQNAVLAGNRIFSVYGAQCYAPQKPIGMQEENGQLMVYAEEGIFIYDITTLGLIKLKTTQNR
jgi:hypothetical protein